MITRINGGNSGIAEYLENGRKAEREYTRDELDHRLILSGNLETTNQIIQSIENNGQERYLHITLSFQENDVSPETLKSVTNEYKSLLMNAYHEDEYNFYAEAHLPKIKNILNNATGETFERKPHIHIVIPETNLITGKKLLPTGKVTFTEQYMDAIQEHVNYKYKLASPKDTTRVSDNNYANVLSRTKGDLFKERNAELKKEILNGISNKNISTFKDFGHYLKGFGEVKLRKPDTDNPYYAIKFKGDSKFTNLKNPLFSTGYIENRDLTLIKPTSKQVESRITQWMDRVSYEVKHIYPKSASIREAYKALDEQGKNEFLKKRINHYDKENKLSESRGREGNQQRGLKQPTRPSLSRRSNRLSYMPQRSLVYGIRGSSRPTGERNRSADGETSKRVLPNDANHHLGEPGAKSFHADQAMRWNNAGERSTFTRGIKTISESSVLHDEYWQHLNDRAQNNEIETMREIRDNIDPVRFISALQKEFNIRPNDYPITNAKDGTPRFKVASRNMNASDFLTKHMNLSWEDAKVFMLKTYAAQQENIPYSLPYETKKLSKEQASERFSSLSETRKELRNIVRNERNSLYNDIKNLRSQIYLVRGNDREVAKGLIVYHKLTSLESILEIDRKGREFLTDYHTIWNEDKDPMKALQKLKEIINHDDSENSIEQADPVLSLKSKVEAQQRIQQLQQTRLKDLVLQKSQDKLVFINPENEKPVFTDKGLRIIASKEASNDEVALMLEYSKEKFGGVLKLNGDDEFKAQCAIVAAEKGMNIILKPEQFNDLMKQHKADLAANHIQPDFEESATQETSVESGQMVAEQVSQPEAEQVSQAEAEQISQPEVEQIEEHEREIYLVSHSLMGDENEGLIFHSKEEAQTFYENNKMSEISRFVSSGDVFEDSTLISKVIHADEIDQYPDATLGEFSTPYNVLANSFADYKRQEEESTKNISSLIQDYAAKAESEGLEFFVKDVEQEITSKSMNYEEATDHLEKEMSLMRNIKNDMQQDDSEHTQ